MNDYRGSKPLGRRGRWVLTIILIVVLACMMGPNRRQHVLSSEHVESSPVFSEQLRGMIADMDSEPVMGQEEANGHSG